MAIGTDIHFAGQMLKEGNLVAIPTETVYGLAANGLDPEAVVKIYEAKKRPSFNPLILHVANYERALDLVAQMPEKARLLAQKFWPGPLTLVLPKKTSVPDIVTSGLDTVAIRVPHHPLTLQLLNEIDFPLAAPSANVFGYISPTKPEHVLEQMEDKISYLLDGGACVVGVESTIVKADTNEVVILREGGVSKEDIEIVIGKISISANEEHRPLAPGMLSSHYAPRAKLVLGNIESLIDEHKDLKIGVLSFRNQYQLENIETQLILSESGDLSDAARNIFDFLRKLDTMELDLIIAEEVPENGIGRAINDRLRRAAAEH